MMMVLADVALGEETGFDNEDISEPSTPQSVIQEDGDDVGDRSQSNRQFRGKGALWSDCLGEQGNDFVSHSTFDDVKTDAVQSNYSKIGSSSTDVHTLVCRIKGCNFKKKYRRMGSTGPFVSKIKNQLLRSNSGQSVLKKIVLFTIKFSACSLNFLEIFQLFSLRTLTRI